MAEIGMVAVQDELFHNDYCNKKRLNLVLRLLISWILVRANEANIIGNESLQ